MNNGEISEWFENDHIRMLDHFAEDPKSRVGASSVCISIHAELLANVDTIALEYFDGNMSACMSAGAWLLSNAIEQMTDME